MKDKKREESSDSINHILESGSQCNYIIKGSKSDDPSATETKIKNI